jgi:hypothetical protein
MGRGTITSAGGLAAFMPLINGVANIKQWDDKFQQVRSSIIFCSSSLQPCLKSRQKGRELEKLSERQSIYYAAYCSGMARLLQHIPS